MAVRGFSLAKIKASMCVMRLAISIALNNAVLAFGRVYGR
jgi:hypothetical protein